MKDFPNEPLGPPVPHVGFEAEVLSLRHGCGLVERSRADRLGLQGEDRLRFLNGQMTCDLRALDPGSGTYGFFTSAKGKIEADATVLALEDQLLLVLPPGLGAAVKQRLERYIITDRVEVTAAEPARRLTFVGPLAGAWLEGMLGRPVPKEAFAHCDIEVDGRPGRWVREGRLGKQAFSLWLAPESADSLRERFMEACARDSMLQPVGREAYESFRIEAGMSRFGQDFGPDNLPQETGIDSAVSYSKGCYLGQEVVARLHYRGQVSGQLRRLELTGPRPAPLPAELFFEGRSAGSLTSVAPAPEGAGLVGIGYVQRRAFEPGTELEVVNGGVAVVQELPALF